MSCTAPFHVKNNVSYTITSSWWWHNSIVCRGDLLLIRIYHFQRSSTNLTKNVFLLVVCPHVCVAVQRRICKIFKYKILFGLNRWHLYPFPVNPRCERWAWKTHIALLHCLQNKQWQAKMKLKALDLECLSRKTKHKSLDLWTSCKCKVFQIWL